MADLHEKPGYEEPLPLISSAETGKLDELPQPQGFEDINPLSYNVEPLPKIEDEPARMVCSCGEVFFVPLAFSGKAAVCPTCHREVKLPEENFLRTTCICGKAFKIPCVLAGRRGICPQCGKQIKIPEKSAVQVFLDEPSHEACSQREDEMLSDNHLNDIAGILLTRHLKNSAPKNVDIPQKQTTAAKNAEKIYVRIDCLCGRKIMVPITVSHRQIKCPQCGKAVKLAENNFLRIKCLCEMEFKVPRILEGKSGVCPRCGKRLKITAAQPI